MSYRMACELGDRVAGIASLAGSMTAEPDLCPDTGRVHVLQIHGTEDDSVLYSAAEPSADFWAQRDGCGEPSAGENRDLVIARGDETEVLIWDCPDDAQVELWSIVGDGHLPSVNQDFSRQMLSWLFERPRD
jgi:poly(3-hydroxybutyrate) depolymerase